MSSLRASPVHSKASTRRLMVTRQSSLPGEATVELDQLIRTFQHEHRKYKLPIFEIDPNVLEGLEIFWKEEQDDD